MNVRNAPEFLRSLAQNDYMIDSKYLPAGVALNAIADLVEAQGKALDMAQYELVTLNPRLSQPYRSSVEAVIAHLKTLTTV